MGAKPSDAEAPGRISKSLNTFQRLPMGTPESALQGKTYPGEALKAELVGRGRASADEAYVQTGRGLLIVATRATFHSDKQLHNLGYWEVGRIFLHELAVHAGAMEWEAKGKTDVSSSHGQDHDPADVSKRDKQVDALNWRRVRREMKDPNP